MASTEINRQGCVAVHVGAGYHSNVRSPEYKAVCREACLRASNLLKQGATAVEAVSLATTILENSALTNAGYGSNLTGSGDVECDASLMDGSTYLYGAVGGIKGIYNPIRVATALVHEQKTNKLPLGLVAPCCLVGDGATQWAISHGIESCSSNVLISDKARKTFGIYKRRLENSLGCQKKLEAVEDDGVNDTVGAVCVDCFGNVASSVSSGGIILKQPGRVGQAFMYGCGCWAENAKETAPLVGVSTSGCGEYITKTLLASQIAGQIVNALGSDPIKCIHDHLIKKYIESPYLPLAAEKLVGVLILSGEGQGDLLNITWAHSTASMCIAYMLTDDLKCHATMSRLPEDKAPGKVVLAEGVTVRL